MRIGLYGMPSAGKTYILDKIHFIETLAGSKMLREICPNFDLLDETGKKFVRQELANSLMSKDTFIMDGHYAFGDKIAFTENDGILYDAILYLYISPEIIMERMNSSERNKKYLSYDIAEWQENEIKSLRLYCHENNKDFYVIDNPPENDFTDVSEIVEFIRTIVEGFSCVSFAEKCAKEILLNSKSDTITLMDGDKTITVEDSSYKVFGYTTHLYDGNFYTGYQSWRQGKEFEKICLEELTQMPVSFNQKVISKMDEDTFILTSGHEKVWKYIAGHLNTSFFQGIEMSSETKLYITKILQNAGKKIVAYGDGMNDYYMLKQADCGFLVTKENGSISRSLKGRNLEGLQLV